MPSLPINAHIQLLEGSERGAYYEVKLAWLPRVGEFIDLHSFLDQASNHPSVHHGVVVAVVHELHDVSKEHSSGHHFPTVYVKPAKLPFN